MTKKERQLIFDKYEGHCAYCGCELEKGWHVDHLEPIKRIKKVIPSGYIHKGTPSQKWEDKRTIIVGCENPEMECMSNYMPSCASCNVNKHSMSLEEFRKLIKGFMNHLNKINTQYKVAKRYGLVEETNSNVLFHFERIEMFKAENFEFGDFVVLKKMETHFWAKWFEEPLMVQKVEKNPVNTNFLITVYRKNRLEKGVDTSRRFHDWELKKVNIDK